MISRGAAEEIGNAKVFTLKIGIVGVNSVENEFTSIYIAAKNGSSRTLRCLVVVKEKGSLLLPLHLIVVLGEMLEKNMMME